MTQLNKGLMALPSEDRSNASRAYKTNYREYIFLTLLMFSKRMFHFNSKQTQA